MRRLEITEQMIDSYMKGIEDTLTEQLGRKPTEEEVKVVLLKLAKLVDH